MTFNWFRLAYGLIKDGTIHYVPTSLDYDYMSNMLRVSMLELPPIESTIIETNLVANWVNSGPSPWDEFTVSVDPTLASLGQDAASGEGRCDADLIPCKPNERVRVRVTGEIDTEPPTLWVGDILQTVDDGDDFIAVPTTVGGDVAVTLYQDPTIDTLHQNVLITITRLYGY